MSLWTIQTNGYTIILNRGGQKLLVRGASAVSITPKHMTEPGICMYVAVFACGGSSYRFLSGTDNASFSFVFTGRFDPSPDLRARVRAFYLQGHRLKFGI